MFLLFLIKYHFFVIIKTPYYVLDRSNHSIEDTFHLETFFVCFNHCGVGEEINCSWLIVFRWNVHFLFSFNCKEEQQGNINWNKELREKKWQFLSNIFQYRFPLSWNEPFMKTSSVHSTCKWKKNSNKNKLFYGFLSTAEKHLRFDELLYQPENYFFKKRIETMAYLHFRFKYLVSALLQGLSTFCTYL